MAEDIVEETLDAAYQLFTPRAGGIVDRHRKETARREAAAQDQRNIDERVDEPSYRAVKVTPESPEIVVTNLVSIPPLGSAMILPGNPYRYRATLQPLPAALSGLSYTTSTTSPGAAAALVAAGPLPGGLYTVNSLFNFAGTVSTLENMNMQVEISAPGTTSVFIPLLTNASATMPQVQSQQVFAVPPGGTVTLVTIHAGTAGAQYQAQLSVSPLSSYITVGKDANAVMNGSGYALTMGESLPTYTRGQMWGWNPSSAVLQVSVLAEMYAPEVRQIRILWHRPYP